MTIETLNASELITSDVIIGDRLHAQGSIGLGVVKIHADGDGLITVLALSMSDIARTIAYGSDESVTVRRSTHGRCRPNLCRDPGKFSDCSARSSR